jgi:lipopolysaccharide export system permease protein
MQYNILLKDITFNIRNPGPREMSSVDVWAVIKDRRATLRARRDDQAQLVDNLRLRVAQDYFQGISDVYNGSQTVARISRELEASVAQLVQEATRPIVDRTLQNYELEFHKKFSIPFACLTFIIFAFPVGLLTRRAGRAVGFGIGLLVSTIYWSMLIAGQTLGINNPALSPALAMWLPNIVILVMGGAALLIRVRR